MGPCAIMQRRAMHVSCLCRCPRRHVSLCSYVPPSLFLSLSPPLSGCSCVLVSVLVLVLVRVP
eukprot:7242543-Alexandrium_andersonii.AAC.1